MPSLKLLLVCLVFREIYGYEQVELGSGSAAAFLRARSIGASNNGFHSIHRNRRQTVGPAPPFFSGRSSSSSSDSQPFIPKIDPPPAGSILTYNGKAISTNIGAFSISPKTERRTPSINRNRPQYATYRGALPPAIPDIVPKDYPQFRDNKGVVGNFPPSFGSS